MRVHHLNCGSMRPAGLGVLGRLGNGPGHSELVCHCLLIECAESLVLVDTGFGLEDVSLAPARLPRRLVKSLRPALAHHETAVAQIEALGFSRRDVHHIIVTHLDPDHAGGLSDFPHAQVHVLADEHAGATGRMSAKERARYLPSQWGLTTRWQLYTPRGEHWFGFESVRDLSGLPPELLMIPMSGHSRGHAAVAINTPSGWLLHCGDAYFQHGDVHAGCPCASAVTLFQRALAHNHSDLLTNQRRLKGLLEDPESPVRVFCSHDPGEFEENRMITRRTHAH